MRTKWSLVVLLGVFLVTFARSAGIAQDFGPQQDVQSAIEGDSRLHEFSQNDMPWPVYQDLTDRDLRAIYEYLRTIPSLPSTPQ